MEKGIKIQGAPLEFGETFHAVCILMNERATNSHLLSDF